MSVTLKSNDGQEFKITEEACFLSRFLKNQIQNGKNEIEVEDIKGEILKLVVDYLNYYSKNEIPKIPDVLSSNDLKKEVCDWDYKFVAPLTYEQTFHLINAGLLLELDHLHDLACAKIAAFMKGKSPEDVNKEFTIECQLTQEEAKQLGLDAN
jgi:S-phase kinase-associated protein 1